MEDQRGALHIDVNGIPHRAGDAWETCRTGGRCHTELPDGPRGDHKHNIWSHSLLSAESDFRMGRLSSDCMFLAPVQPQPSRFGRIALVPTGISWRAVGQGLCRTARHSQTPSVPAGSAQDSALQARQLLPSQLIYQLIVKLLQEFNFLICSDFQNSDSVFQTNFGM